MLGANLWFVALLVAYMLLQILVLKIQENRPRFLIPQALRDELVGDYYRYEHYFEEEANMSRNSYLSNPIESKAQRTQIRQAKMMAEECIICCIPMGNSISSNAEISTFLKTPCNHKFHRACLLEWMRQKYSCPVCRKVLPQYIEDQF